MKTYVMGEISVDPRTRELRHGQSVLPAESRLFDLAYLLVSNSDRLISKQEIVDVVWDGRAVSDNAISTAIKDLRRLLGDDGQRQAIIKTVHGQGFRCVAEITEVSPATPIVTAPGSLTSTLQAEAPSLQGKPSIAVLPFQDLTAAPTGSPIAYAIPTELISAFSRLRWLAVTARGSAFRFQGPEISYQSVRETLGVEYLLTGSVELFDRQLMLMIELSETRQGRVIWSETFQGRLDDVHEFRAQISAAVVGALEIHVPAHEADRARTTPTEHLDAWAQFHLGLQHMYRFNPTDNEIAAGHFEAALRLQPEFARAHAGLSFTAFQNAFLNYKPDRDNHVRAAISHADRGMELDALDPFTNYNMGRSCWIDGKIDAGMTWLTRSTDISPNYAQGHYVNGLMHVLAGATSEARDRNSVALKLSPIDPLSYAMLSCQSMSFINEQKYDEAIKWAERGAMAPGAHFLVTTTAAIANQLAGEHDKAKRWIDEAQLRSTVPLTKTRYFNAFPYADTDSRSRITTALSRLNVK